MKRVDGQGKDLSGVPSRGRENERRLTKVFRSLEPEDRSTLLAFGEFLAARAAESAPRSRGPMEPDRIPRPPDESVVGAIKRLSRSYYMLDRSAMLNDTSSLMGAHVLQGRPAKDVIDELEALFARYYTKYREEQESKES
jgi:hypothetical protein